SMLEDRRSTPPDGRVAQALLPVEVPGHRVARPARRRHRARGWEVRRSRREQVRPRVAEASKEGSLTGPAAQIRMVSTLARSTTQLGAIPQRSMLRVRGWRGATI